MPKIFKSTILQLNKWEKKELMEIMNKSVLAESYTLGIASRIIQYFLPEYSSNVDI